MGFTFDFHPSTFIAMYIFLSILCYFFVYKKIHGETLCDLAIMLSLILYCLIIVKLVLLPIRVYYQVDPTLNASLYWQLSPFKTISKVIQANTWQTQLLGNIAIFIPIPFFVSYFHQRYVQIKYTFITSALISILLELIQVLINYVTKFPNKVFDIDDILLNVVGAILGYMILTALSKSHYINTKSV